MVSRSSCLNIIHYSYSHVYLPTLPGTPASYSEMAFIRLNTTAVDGDDDDDDNDDGNNFIVGEDDVVSNSTTSTPPQQPSTVETLDDCGVISWRA